MDEVKEAECLYSTPPDNTEEGVSERNNYKNKKYAEEKMKAKKHILRAP